MPRAAGEPISIRLPYGLARELRELTGQPVGKIARGLLEAYRERLKADAAREQSK